MLLRPILQLFKIQSALNLRRRRSMVFLCVKVQIVLDAIILLKPFLVELLVSKQHLTMNSQPTPISAALVSVVPPMPIYLDIRKNSPMHWHWKLVISMYGIQELVQPMIPMNPLIFVMKFLLTTLLYSSPLQISRHLLFVNPVKWLVLSTVCRNPTTQPGFNKIKQELCLEMPINLAIFICQVICCHQSRPIDIKALQKKQPHNQFHGDTNFHCTATGLIWAKN